jgi:hypothetical protein
MPIRPLNEYRLRDLGTSVNGGVKTSQVAAQRSAILGRCDQALETGQAQGKRSSKKIWNWGCKFSG